MDLFPDCFVYLNIQPPRETTSAFMSNQLCPQKHRPFQFYEDASVYYQNSRVIKELKTKLDLSNLRMVSLRFLHFCMLNNNR